MNPLTNVKNINKLNEIELSKGLVNKKSWHDIYKGSAWIFIGGLLYDLTEGDIVCVFSQYGEIVNVNLVRDKKTGKPKGYCFLCYSNQKSSVLAVDNLNGIKLVGRTIRVDHVANYKPPKDNEDDDEITKQLKSEGCAPKLIKTEIPEKNETIKLMKKEKKKHKKDKKKKKLASREKKEIHLVKKIKKEKFDPGYEKYDSLQPSASRYNQDKDKESSVGSSSSYGSVSDQEPSSRIAETTNLKSGKSKKYSGKELSSSYKSKKSALRQSHKYEESSSDSEKHKKTSKEKEKSKNGHHSRSYEKQPKKKLSESKYSSGDESNSNSFKNNRSTKRGKSGNKNCFNKQSPPEEVGRSHKRQRHHSSSDSDRDANYRSNSHHVKDYHKHHTDGRHEGEHYKNYIHRENNNGKSNSYKRNYSDG